MCSRLRPLFKPIFLGITNTNRVVVRRVCCQLRQLRSATFTQQLTSRPPQLRPQLHTSRTTHSPTRHLSNKAGRYFPEISGTASQVRTLSCFPPFFASNRRIRFAGMANNYFLGLRHNFPIYDETKKSIGSGPVMRPAFLTIPPCEFQVKD